MSGINTGLGKNDLAAIVRERQGFPSIIVMNWFSQQTIWLFQQEPADTPIPGLIVPLPEGWDCPRARAEVNAGLARWVLPGDVSG